VPTEVLEGVVGGAETALVADAVAQELKTDHAHGATVCGNCGTKLLGAYCYVCGQSGDDHRRALWHLVEEALEGLFHFDGRLLATVPALLFRPGTISARYLKGQRQRFVTPFRMYLISSVLFLIAVSLVMGDLGKVNLNVAAPKGGAASIEETQRRLQAAANDTAFADVLAALQQDAAEATAAGDAAADGLTRSAAALASSREASVKGLNAAAGVLDRVKASGKSEVGLNDAISASVAATAAASSVTVDAPAGAAAVADLSLGSAPAAPVKGDGKPAGRSWQEKLKCGVRRALLPEDETAPNCTVEIDATNVTVSDDVTKWPVDFRRHLVRQTDVIVDDPSRFVEAVNRWTSRVLISLFPIYALLLAFTNFWKRRFFYYDHVIVSLHFHAFIFLFASLLIAASVIIPVWILWLAFFIWGNYGLYEIHRRVYGCGRFSSALRTLTMDFLYLIILSFVPVVLTVSGFLTA
jgi:hypothetical protein